MTIEEMRAKADVPIVIADSQGIITYVNGRFEAVFGWLAEEIVGKPISAIIPRNLHSAHHLGFSRFLMTGEPTLLNRPLRLKAVRKDGQEFDAEHFIVAETQGGHWIFGACIRPVD